MEVIIQKSKEDFIRFYKYYCFKRKRTQHLLLIILVAIYISIISDSKTLAEYLITFLLSVLGLSFCVFVIPYISSLFRLRKRIRTMKEIVEKLKISIVEEGLKIEYETSIGIWKWESINYIENSPDYLYIVSRINNSSIIIPKVCFKSEPDADLFYEIIQNKSTNGKGQFKIQDGKHLYRYGLIGIIPNVGVFAGLILIYKGFFNYSDKKLVIIGVADILFTIVFWYVFTSGTIQKSLFADTDAKLAQSQVNSLVKNIEFYKIQHGEYPNNLEQVNDTAVFVWITDPFLNKGRNNKNVNFHYFKIRNKYTLFSVGLDNIPNTKDDIYPTVTMGDTIKFGFVKKQAASL